MGNRYRIACRFSGWKPLPEKVQQYVRIWEQYAKVRFQFIERGDSHTVSESPLKVDVGRGRVLARIVSTSLKTARQ